MLTPFLSLLQLTARAVKVPAPCTARAQRSTPRRARVPGIILPASASELPNLSHFERLDTPIQWGVVFSS